MNSPFFKNQRFIVHGLGLSGSASANFLISRGATVEGYDDCSLQLQKPEILQLQNKGLTIHPQWESVCLNSCSAVIVSPGIAQEHPLYKKALSKKVPIYGETELACRFLTNRMVGITGSNGKTTVTSLITHLLNDFKIPARAVGNIGVPLISLVDNINPNEILIVELSSYQLETLNCARFETGAILNITPNHLDRYPSMNEYAAAKLRLGKNLKKGGTLYMRKSDAEIYREKLIDFQIKTIGYTSDCDIYCDHHQIFINEKIEDILPVSYRGIVSHDIDNLLNAYALCLELGAPISSFWESLKRFKKPPHRLEFVKVINGVSYFDDSKATSLDAVVQAVKSMKGDVILIAGGMHKGASYIPWITSFQGKVKAVFAIGQAASLIHQDLSSVMPVVLCATFEEAVEKASEYASKGENILLSPGCSSLDMFKDYAHRGQEFQRLVHQRKERG